jgi:hypothetical protein
MHVDPLHAIVGKYIHVCLTLAERRFFACSCPEKEKLKYLLASLLIALSMVAYAETEGWVTSDGRSAPNSDAMKSIDGFGGSLIVTPDPDWEEKWNTAPEVIPRFATAKDVAYGETLTILTFFINPKVDASGAIDVRCDFKVIRPDRSVSTNETDIPCAKGILQGSPKNVRMTAAVIKYIGEESDPPGKWIVEVRLTDKLRGTSIPLRTDFTLKKDGGNARIPKQ